MNNHEIFKAVEKILLSGEATLLPFDNRAPTREDVLDLIESIAILVYTQRIDKAPTDQALAYLNISRSQYGFTEGISRQNKWLFGAADANELVQRFAILAKDIANRLSYESHQSLFVGAINFSDLRHDFDKKALGSVAEKLKSIPGFSSVGSTVNKYEEVKNGIQRVRISYDQVPQLYSYWAESCRRVGLDPEGNLFIDYSVGWNPTVTSVDNPRVCMGAIAGSLASPPEITFMFGQVLGHHLLQQSHMAMLAFNSDLVGKTIRIATLGLGSILSEGIDVSLKYWLKMSAFTCDRIGVLVSQDPDAAISFLLKSAGIPIKMFSQMNTREFVGQSQQYDIASGTDKTMMALLANDQSSFWNAYRARELSKWIQSGEYQSCLESARTYERRLLKAQEFLQASKGE